MEVTWARRAASGMRARALFFGQQPRVQAPRLGQPRVTFQGPRAHGGVLGRGLAVPDPRQHRTVGGAELSHGEVGGSVLAEPSKRERPDEIPIGREDRPVHGCPQPDHVSEGALLVVLGHQVPCLLEDDRILQADRRLHRGEQTPCVVVLLVLVRDAGHRQARFVTKLGRRAGRVNDGLELLDRPGILVVRHPLDRQRVGRVVRIRLLRLGQRLHPRVAPLDESVPYLRERLQVLHEVRDRGDSSAYWLP